MINTTSTHPLTEFRKIIDNYAALNAAEWEYLMGHLEVMECKKDDLIHQSGTLIKDLFFLINGTVRKFSQHGETQITNNVYSNQRFFTDLLSVSEQSPSIYSFECLNDTTIVRLSIEFSEKAFSMSPTFSTIARRMYQQAFLEESLRLRVVLTKTPTEQYLRFVSENKELSRQLPQNKIADCLNIAPETLSRIKKKLLNISV